MRNIMTVLFIAVFLIVVGNLSASAQSIIGDGSSIATGGNATATGGNATSTGGGATVGNTTATGGAGGSATVGDTTSTSNSSANNEGVDQQVIVNTDRIQTPSPAMGFPQVPAKGVVDGGMYGGYNFNPYLRQGEKKYPILKSDSGGCPAGNFAHREWLVRGESPFDILDEEINGSIPSESDFLSIKMLSGEKSWSFGLNLFGIGAQGSDSGNSAMSQGAGGGGSVISGKTIAHMLITACGKKELVNVSSSDDDL